MFGRVTALVGALLFVLATGEIAVAESRNILLLDTFGRDFEPYRYFVATLRTELSRQSPEPIDFFEASLATARFAEDRGEDPFVEYLQSLFAEHRLDLVIAVGAPAARFVQRNRQHLFPSTPMVLTGVDQRRLNEKDLTINDAAVSFKTDRLRLFANILEVLPQTKNIAVIIGTAPNERFWLEEMQKELQPLAGKVEFTWINTLSFDDALERVKALPPDSAIYFGPFAVDSAMLPAQEASAVAAIRAVANAPIFATFDAYLGHGIVGGPMIALGDLARAAAAASVRILQGELPGDIKAPPIELGPQTFDWREMQRFGISEANLPPGSSIRFREPTVWQLYKWYIVSAVAFVALQTIFMTALLINRQRLRRANAERQRAETRMQELQTELTQVSRLTAMSEMVSNLAHELNQPLSAIASYLQGSHALLASKDDADSALLREALGKAGDQALRAGEIIRRLRHFAERGEIESKVESLNQLVEEASALAMAGAKRQNIHVAFRPDPRAELVLVDKVQVQQVLHNIVRNAIEAMAEAKSSVRELRITTRRMDHNMVEIEVADSGPGISPSVADQLFQPFITTKKHGLGVGLSISRTIIEAHGGRIWAEANPGGGAMFRMTLRSVQREELVDAE